MASNNNEYNLFPRDEKEVLKEIKQVNPDFVPVYQKVFVSYCKDDTTDPQWINRVYQFVYCLLALGIDVSVDFLDHSEGNMAVGITNKIETSDKILMINSPEYYKLITQKGKKEDQESKSIAYQGQLIYSELFNKNGIKVIPIFLKHYQNYSNYIPSAFKRHKNYNFSKKPPSCLDLANHLVDKFTQLVCLLMGIDLSDWENVKINKCREIQLLEVCQEEEIVPDLDRPLTENSPEKFFSDLVPLVLPFWQCLALELEVDLKKVQEMFHKESESERCFQFLYHWWKKQPDATFNDLIDGLRAVIGVDTRQLVMSIQRYAILQQQQQQQQQQQLQQAPPAGDNNDTKPVN